MMRMKTTYGLMLEMLQVHILSQQPLKEQGYMMGHWEKNHWELDQLCLQ